MSWASDIEKAQARIEHEHFEDQQARQETPPAPIVETAPDYCAQNVNHGFVHEFNRRGRCWYCARPRPLR